MLEFNFAIWQKTHRCCTKIFFLFSGFFSNFYCIIFYIIWLKFRDFEWNSKIIDDWYNKVYKFQVSVKKITYWQKDVCFCCLLVLNQVETFIMFSKFVCREKSNMKKHLERQRELQMHTEGLMLILTSPEQR